MDDDQAHELDALEDILRDPNREPMKLSYGLLKYITKNFSNEIGRGGFGVVYKGDLENGVVAVKMSNAYNLTDKQFMDEIKCLKSANHKNIVRFLGYCADTQEEILPLDGTFVMAGRRNRLLCFEYVPNGNIRQYLEKEMDDDQAHELDALEDILRDPNREPMKLSYGLLKYITKNFSNEIGRGGFGVVYKGDLENGVVAVKMSNAYNLTDKQFMDEIKCLKSANHKNIVRFLGYCADTQEEILPLDGTFVMAGRRNRLLCFEYVPNGNIRQYLEKDKSHGDHWPTRYQMIRGICQGLQFLHDNQINHRDLKLENVMLDADMEAKIADFGLSRFLDQGQSKIITQNICGTLRYIAPEIIDKGEVSFKSDIYALGIIIIELLTGINMISLDNWDESLSLLECPRVGICIKVARNCTDAKRDSRPTIREVIRDLDELESMIPKSSTDKFRHTHVYPWEADPARLVVRGVTAETTLGTFHRGLYDGLDVAVKLIDWGEGGLKTQKEITEARTAFLHGVSVWHKLEHPNVTKFIGAIMGARDLNIQTENGNIDIPSNVCCVVMEYLAGGVLDKFLFKNRRKKLAFKVVVQIALGLARGLSYLHSKKIVHRDVRTENILLDKSGVKITEFCVARIEAENPSSMTGKTGTLGYMAPEVLNGKPYNRKCDVYSYGICLAEVYCCDMLYPDMSYSELTHAVVRQNLRPVIPRCCPSSLANIMRRCWDADPDKRPEMAEVVSMLEAIDTSKGGGMIPEDQTTGCLSCFRQRIGP